MITEGASEGEGAYLGRSSARVLVRPPRGHGADSNLNAVVMVDEKCHRFAVVVGGMKRRQRTITFVTGNPKKLQEFKEIMGTELPIASASVNCAELDLNQLPAYSCSAGAAGGATR